MHRLFWHHICESGYSIGIHFISFQISKNWKIFVYYRTSAPPTWKHAQLCLFLVVREACPHAPFLSWPIIPHNGGCDEEINNEIIEIMAFVSSFKKKIECKTIEKVFLEFDALFSGLYYISRSINGFSIISLDVQ